MRDIAKKLIPPTLWRKLGILRRRWITRDDHKRSAQEVFTRIYEKRIWEGADDGFSSGAGSRKTGIVDPYVDAIHAWAAEHQGNEKTALDMGCGDFHVGQRIHQAFGHYIAADIVPILIEKHNSTHACDHLVFRCIDAIEDPLPPEADVVFFRQVLQHLSNTQIASIVHKLRQFPHVIITEHLPATTANIQYNLDKPHGGDTRLSQSSGIDLERPPFDLTPISSNVLLEVPAGEHPQHDGIIRTTWYQFQTRSKS